MLTYIINMACKTTLQSSDIDVVKARLQIPDRAGPEMLAMCDVSEEAREALISEGSAGPSGTLAVVTPPTDYSKLSKQQLQMLLQERGENAARLKSDNHRLSKQRAYYLNRYHRRPYTAWAVVCRNNDSGCRGVSDLIYSWCRR